MSAWPMERDTPPYSCSAKTRNSDSDRRRDGSEVRPGDTSALECSPRVPIHLTGPARWGTMPSREHARNTQEAFVPTHYTASKRRDPGREKYSVIFRHPVRLDNGGRPGRRVRRGLGTSDGAEADRLVAELDDLLRSEEYWSYAARGTAAGRFDPRVVSIFFEGLDPSSRPSAASLREAIIALPGIDEGYRRVLLLGTTGAGKTTVVRQLLGTDPVKDRFPSTSTAKTTVADTELVLREGSYHAVVTFFPRDEIVDHLADCASKAALTALRGASELTIRTTLLDHENQRFRFSYVLGRQSGDTSDANEAGTLDDLDDLDDLDSLEASVASESETFEAEPSGLAGIDLTETARVVDEAIVTLRALVVEHGDAARTALSVANEDDERVAKEIFDEELDRILRQDERFNGVVDSLLDQIEKRFEALPIGDIELDRQGWPATWVWQSEDRSEFLRGVNRFTSNYAPMFGHLLSPLVNGIRVAGPFRPTWLSGQTPRLVLIDGEGLGHTPKTSASLPTTVAKLIEDVDAVVLVDNATQPVQAAPASAIRSMLTSGSSDKLIFCFTHFDAVEGDNLASASARARHVLGSAENLLASVRDEFNPRSERALRRRLEANRVFLSDIDRHLDPATAVGKTTIAQIRKLLQMIDRVTDRPELGPGRPVYDKTNLVLAVAEATAMFHRQWRARLGLGQMPEVQKEHWTKVKALNRRFAESSDDQYGALRPAADLREALKDEIYKTIEVPLRWDGERPADDVALTAVLNALSSAVAARLAAPIRERLSVRPLQAWQESYALSGSGSTFVRARRISDEILARSVPAPSATPSPDHNDFLHSVIALVEEAATEVGCRLE